MERAFGIEVAAAVLLLLSVTGCRQPAEAIPGPTTGDIDTPSQVDDPRIGVPGQYYLAYLDTNNRLQVLWSVDGLAWSGKSLSDSTAVPISTGICAMASSVNLLLLAIPNSSSSINFQWGQVPASLDQSAQASLPVPIDSACSGISVYTASPKLWLVAFRSEGRAVVALYDHEKQQFAGTTYAPPGTLNSEVVGRPTIVRLGEWYVLAWRRKARGRDTFATARAVWQPSSDGGELDWRSVHVCPLAPNEEFRSGVQSDPALASDGDHVYLAGIRESRQGVNKWKIEVTKSRTGLVPWERHGVLEIPYLDREAQINMARNSDGTLLVVAISPSGDAAGNSGAALYSGESWTVLEDPVLDSMFSGFAPSHDIPFSLIRAPVR